MAFKKYKYICKYSIVCLSGTSDVPPFKETLALDCMHKEAHYRNSNLSLCESGICPYLEIIGSAYANEACCVRIVDTTGKGDQSA